MSTDSGKAYEVLGVKPGVSARELKQAHRDLAKVWHPDRFVHDPRLQEKAQEKLKEINEAYEQLISGRMPKPAPPPRPSSPQPVRQPVTEPVRVRRAATPRQSRGYGFALLAFMVVFALSLGTLLQRRAPAPEVDIPAQSGEQTAVNSPPAADNKKRKPSASSENREPLNTSVTLPVEPLATVTVTIDPRTGLLATSDCPLQTRMTYPSGGQPDGYCNARHPPKLPPLASQREPQNESSMKSFAKRMGL